MPLLDHFHPPWSKVRPWESFHGAWANALAQKLNHGVLPSLFVALPLVRLGGSIEIDVATAKTETGGSTGGKVGTEPALCTPPAPVLAGPIAFVYLDEFEIRIVREEETPRLVAAIELESIR